MDVALVAGNVFLSIAVAALLLAPVAGAAGGWQRAPRALIVTAAAVFLMSMAFLMISWRAIPGGVAAAAAGHAAFLVSALTLSELGRLARRVFGNELAAALAGMIVVIALTIGPFALGPMLKDVSLGVSVAILFANPLVTISTAAGMDLLHIDLIYRLSPLAHRGVALPAWQAACAAYAVFGLAGYGASHLRPRSA